VRVTVHPAGEDACGFYRLTSPARVLADQGADVHLTREVAYECSFDLSHRPVGLVSEPETDVVVLQRPLHRWKGDLIDALQRAGVAVVVEIDDDFGAVHPRNAAWPDAHREWMRDAEARERGLLDGTPVETLSRSGRVWRRKVGVLADESDLWLRRACKHADLVTVTTPALAGRYAPHGRVGVLPNLVPERYLAVSAPPHDGVVVGWGGTVATHPDDLAVTGGGVGRAVTVSGARFRVIGDGVRVRADLGLDQEPEVAGWVPLEGWPSALASFDVGIVPLQPSVFNAGKSALKMAELAAVGVPVVASPTPDNVRLARRGVGLLASDPARWEQWTRLLAENGEARVQLAGRGREVMAGQTYEAHAGRWWDAWTQARANADARLNERTAA
jgi:glycosyltransferase involved in cell wall biosynthesis